MRRFFWLLLSRSTTELETEIDLDGADQVSIVRRMVFLLPYNWHSVEYFKKKHGGVEYATEAHSQLLSEC